MDSDPPRFAHRNLPLLLLQARESVIGRFRPVLNAHGVTEQQWRPAASCDKGGSLVADVGAGNDWRCVVSWHIPGATAVDMGSLKHKYARLPSKQDPARKSDPACGSAGGAGVGSSAEGLTAPQQGSPGHKQTRTEILEGEMEREKAGQGWEGRMDRIEMPSSARLGPGGRVVSLQDPPKRSMRLVHTPRQELAGRSLCA
jgi:hypothetical protein